MTTSVSGLRTGEVARLLDVAEHRIANLIRFRLIPAPEIVGGRRIWRPEDVEAARRVLIARGVIPAVATEVRS
jgi:DNA-binding transcriptional MerR regulator